MSRITLNTKCRLCRAQGTKLYLKGERCFSPKCPLEKKGAVPPGMHGVKRQSRVTDYGFQLKAKQKAKRIYGVNETQFRNYFLKAKTLPGLIGDNLLILLERRLDNFLTTSGLSLSRTHARQTISHKHVFVNGKKLNVSSYLVKLGDEISLDKKTSKLFSGTLRVDQKDFKNPDWMTVDKKNYSAKVTALPSLNHTNQDIDINLIIEYYSR
jgi:small subunit ribosomal protein S4